MPNFGSGAGWGDLLGAGFDLFGMGNNKNPADAGMPYLNQLSQMLPGYFQNYMNAGNQALPQLQQQYGQLLGNPGQFMNKMGQGFQQSPGYQFQVNQATNAANRAAAAGGMLGSPMEQQNVAGNINQMANQDYYNYLNHAMGAYGMGLNGMQDMAKMGLGASSNLANNMSDAYMSQAQLAYAGQANQNQTNDSMWGNLGGLLGSAAGAFF